MVHTHAGAPHSALERSAPAQLRRKRAARAASSSSSSSGSTLTLQQRRRRSSLANSSLPASSNSVSLSYGFLNGQLAYRLPVTLPDRVAADLLVATGTADLWLASERCTGADCPQGKYSVASATSLNQDWNVTYIDGSVSGTIYTLPSLSLAQSTLQGQAFGSADDVEMINFDDINVTGVLGLSLPSNSAIHKKLAPSNATSNTFVSGTNTGSVLSGLWDAANTASTTPRIISLGLQRLPSDGGSSSVNSSLTIGGIDSAYLPKSAYGSISFAPVVATPTYGYEHWTLYLTSLSTTQSGTTSPIPVSYAGQKTINPTVVLDSGSSLNYAPSEMLNAMYGAFVDDQGNRLGPGENGIFYLPCDLPLNITLTLSSTVTIPIHPLDASLYQAYSDIGVGKSSAGCIGSFQSLISSDSPAGADIVLGTPFLRNVYSVFSCEGSLANVTTSGDSSSSCTNPVVGLLPLTANLTQAYADFASVRVHNEQLGDNAAWAISYSSSSTSSKELGTGAKVAIGIVVSLVAIIVLFVLTLFVARRRHARRAGPGDTGSGERVWPAEKNREGTSTGRYAQSLGDGTGGESQSIGTGGGAHDYDGLAASLSPKEQAQLREAALLHGYYDADLFSDDLRDGPDSTRSPLPHDQTPRFGQGRGRRRRGRDGAAGAAEGVVGDEEWAHGRASGATTPTAFGLESTDSRGYGDARRVQREYLRRHPSLERELQRGVTSSSVGGGGGSGTGADSGGGVEIEMEERSSVAHTHVGEERE